MEPGVAAGANGNQQLAVVDARLTMMHMEGGGRAACPAQVAVAVQDLPAEAGEVLPGMGGGPVAGAAEAGGPRQILAARTEERRLERAGQNRLYSRSPSIIIIIIGYCGWAQFLW